MNNDQHNLSFLSLADGSRATVDSDVINKVKDLRWRWWDKKGVVAYHKGQTILLHNMIAPYARVSFMNGDKRDCRRVNLTDRRMQSTRNDFVHRGKLIYDRKNRQTYIVIRPVRDSNGKLYRACRSQGLSYKGSPKNIAYQNAIKVRNDLLTIPPRRLIDEIRQTKPKGKLIYQRPWNSIEARRSVMVNRKTYTASVSISYNDISKNEALTYVQKIRDRMAEMKPKQFVEWVKIRPKWRPTANECIKGWSCWNGHEASYRELKDMHISVFYDEHA